MRLAKDSRGHKSWTLTIVLPAWAILLAKFAVSGISYGGWMTASMGPVEFATAFGIVVSTWLIREHKEKGKETNGSSNL